MIKLSACIEMLFAEIDELSQRIPAAAAAGLDGIEFWSHSNKDLKGIANACQNTGLPVTAMTIEAPEGMLDYSLADKFAQATEQAIAAAQTVGCKILICTTNIATPIPININRNRAHAGVIACLKTAAPLAEEAGVTLVLEPLNILVDHPGYFLTSSREGFQIVEQVGSPAVKLLYDIYHQQITEGNLIATITPNIEKIGHFHTADVPGRYEPGTGEINYANVLAAIDEAGYEGFIGLEYKPTGPTPDTLDHILAVREEINA